jgi:hypothetical protein
MTRSGLTEVDAHSWQGDWDMAAAFVREYGYDEPILSSYRSGNPVNWDSLEDWMFLRTTLDDPNPPSPNSNFVGELLIIRGGRPEQEQTLGFVASMVAAHVEWETKKRHHPDPILAVRPLALVLEGWEGPTLVFSKKKHVNELRNEAWVVNAWPVEEGVFTC